MQNKTSGETSSAVYPLTQDKGVVLHKMVVSVSPADPVVARPGLRGSGMSWRRLNGEWRDGAAVL